MSDNAVAAANLIVEMDRRVPLHGSVVQISGQSWDAAVTVARAYLAERGTIATTKLRCGYIIGVCQNLAEAQAEARYILELLGEKQP